MRYELTEEYSKQILTQLANYYGTSVPRAHQGHYIGRTPKGIYGFYCSECNKTVRIEPNAPAEVEVHEYIHHYLVEKGYVNNFPTVKDEEDWVADQTRRIAPGFGITPRYSLSDSLEQLVTPTVIIVASLAGIKMLARSTV